MPSEGHRPETYEMAELCLWSICFRQYQRLVETSSVLDSSLPPLQLQSRTLSGQKQAHAFAPPMLVLERRMQNLILRIYIETGAAGTEIPIFVFMLVEFGIICFMSKSFATEIAFENIFRSIA